MLCPICGAWSSVLDTREGPLESIRRRRMCGNGHKFPTFEIIGPARNAGQIRRAAATVKAARLKWARDQAIRKDARPRDVLAVAYGMHPRSIDAILAAARSRSACGAAMA